MGKKKKLGLVPKLIIGIILGILIGSFCPEIVCRIVVTASGLFSTFLKFVIPMMILAYVTMGIADLSQGAGKLLAITAGLSYGSTLIAGSCAFLVAITLFPSFMDASALEQIAATAGNSVASLFSISVTPILDTLAAVLLVRQTVFRGGQPDAPAAVPTAPAVTALPAPTHVTVQPLAATRDALADTQRADASAHATPETAAVPAAAAGEILPRYRALYEKNPDLIGWLRIDGTDIDLPVVQTPGDNEYYLRRGFDRFYAVGGTLFLDERCSVSTDAPTANWLIYGHNMHDGSMFGQLVRYRDEDFYKAHPTFTFDTLYEGGTWQVVAAVDTALGADTLPYYTFFDADTKLDWQHRVRAITEKALYDTGVMPEYGAQLLTLSTCGDTRPDTDARFALLAVRID